MSIEIRLTSEQFPHYEVVLNKAKVPFEHQGTLISLDGDNYHKVLAALTNAHSKSLNLKTKSIVHMERLFNLQMIIGRISSESYHFASVEVVEADENAEIEYDEEDLAEEMKEAA